MVTNYSGGPGEMDITVSWGPHERILEEFHAFLLAFEPFAVVPAGGLANVALRISHDEAEVKRAMTNWTAATWHHLQMVAKRAAETDQRYVGSDGRILPFLVTSEFKDLISEATKRKGLASREAAMRQRKRYEDVLQFVMYALMTTGDAPSLGWSFYQILRRGYLPVRWHGAWPKGFCMAFCPAGLPQSTMPPECEPSADQWADGGGVFQTKRPQPPFYLALPDIAVPIVEPSAWIGLVDAPDKSAAFLRHFSPLIVHEECRKLLELLADVVRDMAISDGQLHVDFNPTRPHTEYRLICAPPFRGPFSGIPRSVAQVMARHNGMTLQRDGDETVAWLPFEDGQFAVDWSLWWRPDPADPDELFVLPPHVPVTDGDDLWLLHPSLRAADGEPAVVCMSHETACLSPPLPWTMGEILLSLMPMEIFPPGNEGAGKAEPQPSLFKRMRGRVFV
jgi:hypothetical protein